MSEGEPLFRISLAQWSLHRMIFAGDLHPLEFPGYARDRFGIEAVEYVNGCFKQHYEDRSYLPELKRRADDAGVRSLVFMIDREGDLGDPDEAERARAVERHRPWLESAAVLGCHSIRVNARSAGSRDEQAARAADGLRSLCEHADPLGVNVLVENHGGLSSDGSWLAKVIARVDHPRCGTLPDFGNFCLDWDRRDDPGAWYDRYQGVAELMPFAKAVSAKANSFDSAGNETTIDYRRMIGIVLEAGYRGWVGIEYEGDDPDEPAGIDRTKQLLERVRDEYEAAGVDRSRAPASLDEHVRDCLAGEP